MKEVEVITIVIGALGTATKDFKRWVEKTGFQLLVEMLQKPCFLETAIIRKVLDMK